VTYSLRNQSSDSNFVPLTANVDGDVQRVHWFVDDAYVGTSMANEALAWRAQLSGRHLVRAIDDRGRADSRELNIAFVP
jgi:penicillin-binding protein 1C